MRAPPLLMAAGLLSCFLLSVEAAAPVWNNTATDFNNPASWTGGLPGTADLATFSGAANPSFQPNLTGSISVSSLIFSGAGSSGYALTSTPPAVLSLLSTGTTSGTAAIGSQNTSGTNTVNAPLNLAAAAGTTQYFVQSSGGTLSLGGVISGASNVRTSGGNILFGNANIYTGTTTVASGNLQIQNSNGFGSGTATTSILSGGTIQLSGGMTISGRTLNIVGDGAATDGALKSINSGTNTWAGQLNVDTTVTTRVSAEGTGVLAITGNVVLTGAPVVNNSLVLQSLNSGTGIVSGNISGNGQVLRSATGSGLWTLTGANTHTGGLKLNGTAPLQVSDSTVHAAGNQNITRNGFGTGMVSFAANAVLQMRANGQNDSTTQVLNYGNTLSVVPPSGSISVTVDVNREGGTGTNKVLSLGNTTIGGGSTLNVTGGNGYGLTLGNVTMGSTTGNTHTFNPTTATLSIGGVTGTAPAGSNNTLVLSGTAMGNVVRGVISDGSATTGLSKVSTSSWELQGANTYTGATSISSGTLKVTSLNRVVGGSASSSLGAPTTVANGTIGLGLTTTTGVLVYGGAGETTDRAINLAGTASTGNGHLFNDGTGPLTFTGGFTATGAGPKTFVLGGINPGENSFSGNIVDNSVANTTALRKMGTNTWTISGANSYTGVTNLLNGKLIVDYVNAATGTTTNAALASGTAINMNGGSLEFKAKTGSGNITNQTVNGITLGGNTGIGTLILNQNGGDGMTLNAGTLTRNGGSGVLFDLSAGGTLTTTSSSSSAGNDGLINGTIGLLIKDGSGRIDFASGGGGGAITALNTATNLPTTGGATNVNAKLDGSINLTGAATVNSLRVNTTGTGQSLNVGANNLSFDGGGFLFVGSHDYSITGTGTLNIGVSNGLIIEHFGTGKLTVNNAKLSAGSGSLFVFGNGGLLDLNAASNITPSSSTSGNYNFSGVTARLSYTGANAITLVGGTGNTLGNGNINLNTGGILELATGDLSRNLVADRGGVQFSGNGGFSAFGANRSVLLNNSNATPLTWGSGVFVPDGASLILGSNYSDSTVDFQNSIDLGILTRTVQANNGTSTADTDGRLSGVLSGTGGLLKTGAGTLELTNVNTYTGPTFVRSGKLIVNGSIAASSAVTIQNSGILAGSGSVGGRVTVENGGHLAPGNSPGSLSLGSASLEGGSIYDLQLLSNGDTGSAGVQWDQINVTGDLNIGSLTSGSPFVLKLDTLVNASTSGPLSVWDGTLNHTWAAVIDYATLSGQAFDPALFSIDPSGFANTFTGTFSLVNNGSSLDLQYMAIPEPSLVTTLVFGLAVLGLGRRKRAS